MKLTWWVSRPRSTIALVAALTVLLLLVACDPVKSVQLRNERSQPIKFFFPDGRGGTLGPQQQTSIGTGSGLTIRIEADDGAVLFDSVITSQQLEAADFRIVVTNAGVRLPHT